MLVRFLECVLSAVILRFGSIFCVRFLVLRWVPGDIVTFLKGSVLVQGDFSFWAGLMVPVFVCFVAVFFIWAVLIVFGRLRFSSWKCSGWKCNAMCPMLFRKKYRPF